MAVVFGAVVAVGGFALAHGDYSDYYGDYSDYDDYDDDYDDDYNYGDGGKTEKLLRIQSLHEETERAVKALSKYKSESVNPKLSSQPLKEAGAMKVSENAMDEDVKRSIEKEIEREVMQNIKALQMEVQQIDKLLEKIEKIERGQ